MDHGKFLCPPSMWTESCCCYALRKWQGKKNNFASTISPTCPLAHSPCSTWWPWHHPLKLCVLEHHTSLARFEWGFRYTVLCWKSVTVANQWKLFPDSINRSCRRLFIPGRILKTHKNFIRPHFDMTNHLIRFKHLVNTTSNKHLTLHHYK